MKKIICLLGSMLLPFGANAIEHGCAASAQSMFLACGFDVKEGFLENLGVCSDTSDADFSSQCVEAAEEESLEDAQECAEILASKLQICEKTQDAVHEVAFGEAFADNFVDPLEIGVSVDPNPWFPMVQGNQWVYEASGLDDEGEEVEETIIVTILPAVKLIEGIPCLVVNDVVSEDGDVIEDTDDWFAQDKSGNVWYCGEISKNKELFEGDEPEVAELVDLEGSWKSGRDGGEAGMLLPFSPQVGDLIKTEVLLGEAEDVIEIESLTGSESTDAASCEETCLVTLDYTPLEPGGLENKYYAPGIGMIVETKPDTTERVELIEFNQN